MTDSEFFQFLRQKFGTAKRANKGWMMVPCPTCNPHDARKMKRGIHPKTQSTKCFICEVPLTFDDLIGNKEFTRVQIVGSEEPEEHPQARQFPFTKVIPINELPPDHIAVQTLAKDYLFSLDDYWEFNRVGYISTNNGVDIVFKKYDRPSTSLNTSDSIVFPVFFKGDLVGWQCRFLPGTWNGDKMLRIKMKYMQIFPKGKYLYNYDRAIQYPDTVVVEGGKKALKFPNGVATWGKGITDRQVQLIQKWKRIAFMYDGEDETQKKTKDLAKLINAGPRDCISIDPRDYGFISPDEATEEQCKMALDDSWAKFDAKM